MSSKIFSTLLALTIPFMLPTTSAQTRESSPETIQNKDQAPGFYRMKIGDLQVTAIFDGTLEMNSAVFRGIEKNILIERLKQHRQNEILQTAVNSFLIENGSQKILVDVGAAQTITKDLGKIKKNLLAAGIAPDEITEVFLTHLHLDHVAGLLNEDQTAAFPNATVYANAVDADYWLSTELHKQSSGHASRMFEIAQASLAPYIQNNKFYRFHEEKLKFPGLDAYPLFGHSPGHTGYLLESKGERIIFLGDVIHNHHLQMFDPSVNIQFDWNPAMAIKSRHKVLDLLATEEMWAAGAHTPFPGIGRVRRDNGTSYTWMPVDYTQGLLTEAKRKPLK